MYNSFVISLVSSLASNSSTLMLRAWLDAAGENLFGSWGKVIKVFGVSVGQAPLKQGFCSTESPKQSAMMPVEQSRYR